MNKTVPDFYIYSTGPVYVSVCSSLSEEETIRRVNEEYPTGLDHKWILDAEKKFISGHPNPGPCNYQPNTHKHYLLSC